jgi:lysozyme family protein
MTFDEAFERLIGHEGVYVHDLRDPGGETKYGVSKRSYPGENIRDLTLDRAKLIYRRDYWGPAGCDAAPDGLKFDLFDMAVNAGVGKAIKTLQRAAGQVDDGIIGPRTIHAISSMPSARLVARFNGHRLEHMTSLPHWDRFGRGWAKRLASNLQSA